SRKIILKSDAAPEDVPLTLTGVVRSDITVGTEADKGRIVFGSFRSSVGIPNKVVKIAAPQPGIVLEFDHVEPPDAFVKVRSFKEVKRPEIGGSHWELAVEVPRGSPPGKIPDETAVIMKMPGTPPRHIRIPVRGMITQ